MSRVALLEAPATPFVPHPASDMDTLAERVGQVAEAKLTTSQPPIDRASMPPVETLSSTASPQKQIHNLALSIILLGLSVEEKMHRELDHEIKMASDTQKTIEQLVKLSGKLAIHSSDQDVLEISAEVKTLAQELKEKGIEIFDGNEAKISRERLAELKAHVGSHIERLKTELQKTFTTVIQVKINEMQSLLECLKTIEKYASRLCQTILGHMGGR